VSEPKAFFPIEAYKHFSFLLFSGVLAFGVKESSLFNNVFTALNLGVVAFVVIAGGIHGKKIYQLIS